MKRMVLTTLVATVVACGGGTEPPRDGAADGTTLPDGAMISGDGATTGDAAPDAASDAPPAMAGTVLQPGTGFTGPTPEPPQVGTGPGADAQVIARWDLVPNQTFDAPLELGVVAFHTNGVDRVEFSAAGGPWTAAREMTLNAQTGAYEYHVALRAADVSTDGPVEVRAVAYPRVGLPRVLPPVTLFANARHALPNSSAAAYVAPGGSDTAGDGTAAHPYHTIEHAAAQLAGTRGSAAGATIYLAAGDYPGPAIDNDVAHDRWLTVSAAPGTDPATVRLRSGSRPRVNYLRLANLTIAPTTNGAFLEGFVDTTLHLWVDHCAVVGAARLTSDVSLAHFYTTYITDSTWTNTQDGPGEDLVRNVRVTHILSDAFSGSPMVVNSSVDDIDRETSDAHPDVYQIYQPDTPMENYVVYGLRATRVNSQGIFVGDAMGPAQNVAFVNVAIDALGFSSQWFTAARHVLLWHVTVAGQAFHFRMGASPLELFDVRGSYFEVMDVPDGNDAQVTPALVGAAHNHYRMPTAYRAIAPGTDATSGDPMFANEAARDLHPGAGSPLRNRVTPPLVPADVLNAPRTGSGSVGAFQ